MPANGKKAAIHAFAVGAAAFLEALVRLAIDTFVEWCERRRQAAAQKSRGG